MNPVAANKPRKDAHDQMKPPLETVTDGTDIYRLGQFLGKGGFARCFAVTSEKTRQVVACKIVSKSLLVKNYQKEKMIQEIRIHRNLRHTRIVKFIKHFEDSANVYVLLELCKRRSLMEVLKRRERLTYLESRYFMHQLLDGVSYLHGLNIIHRDLKLGNLFLTHDIQLRIGDFGLATTIGGEHEVRRTLCGTPNYIAPEILEKSGHSYEVDIWSCGCILYTMLVGKAPFESEDLKQTYEKIKQVHYKMDEKFVPPLARQMIDSMLQKRPKKRPMAKALLAHLFFTESPLPANLPESILTTQPRQLTTSATGNRKVFKELQTPQGAGPVVAQKQKDCPIAFEEQNAALKHINSLEKQLAALMSSNYKETEMLPMDRDDAADPASMPVYWVSKWVDYTDKYGLGYQLCDGSLAVLFNDNSRMVLLGSDEVHYIDSHNQEGYHTMANYPKTLEKKVILLKYFKQYMHQHLMTAGASAPVPQAFGVARLPYLRVWFRTQSAIILFLSNGTLQLNFFRDHTKIVLCPLMGAVSYIDKDQNFRTYSLKTMHETCPTELCVRLKYTQTICSKVRERLIKIKPDAAT